MVLRAVVASALLLVALGANAQCPYFPSGWPVEIAIEPSPALAGVPLRAVLGPSASVGIFQPTVTRNGNVVTLAGRFQDYIGIGVPPPPAPVVMPIGSFAPGSYVLRIALLDFNVPNPCPVVDVPFVVAGTQVLAQSVPLDSKWLALLVPLLLLAATASRAARSRRCRWR